MFSRVIVNVNNNFHFFILSKTHWNPFLSLHKFFQRRLRRLSRSHPWLYNIHQWWSLMRSQWWLRCCPSRGEHEWEWCKKNWEVHDYNGTDQLWSKWEIMRLVLYDENYMRSKGDKPISIIIYQMVLKQLHAGPVSDKPNQHNMPELFCRGTTIDSVRSSVTRSRCR